MSRRIDSQSFPWVFSCAQHGRRGHRLQSHSSSRTVGENRLSLDTACDGQCKARSASIALKFAFLRRQENVIHIGHVGAMSCPGTGMCTGNDAAAATPSKSQRRQDPASTGLLIIFHPKNSLLPVASHPSLVPTSRDFTSVTFSEHIQSVPHSRGLEFKLASFYLQQKKNLLLHWEPPEWPAAVGAERELISVW